MLERIDPGTRYGTVRIPSSKSLAHRALICAALADGESVISCHGISRDIAATMACLEGMGAEFEVKEEQIRVVPVESGAKKKHGDGTDLAVLPCGESGSTLRFLLPLAGALGKDAVFEMKGRLPERPMKEYEQVLREHGMTIRREADRLYCSGQLNSGCYTLPGDISSQYITGLLFSLPLLAGDSELKIRGKLESADYVGLTEHTLRAAHITWDKTEDGYLIPGSQCYHTGDRMEPMLIEGDYSGAAFFLCAGAFSEQGITCRNLSADSGQGDRQILEILKRFGADVKVQDGSVLVKKGTLQGFGIDGSMIPDILPVLSVVAAAAKGTTRIFHAERLRLKESDRILSTLTMLKTLGADVKETEDGLIIHGTGGLKGGAEVDPFGDHRIAMSAAVAACICQEAVSVKNAECVEKSYPDFWKDFHSLSRE